jgi:tetratricopeptide (TPR) repeat protein
MTTTPSFPNSQKGAAIALFFICALALRILFLSQARGLEFFQVLGLDAQHYHDWAAQIAKGRAPGSEPYFQGPLYPYFLSLLYRVFGPSVSAVQWVQAILGSASAALAFLLGARVFGRSTGLWAGALTALYGYLMFLETHVVTAPLLLFLLLILAHLLVSALESGAVWRFAVAGLVLGILAVGRGLYLLAIPVALVLLLAFLRGAARKEALRQLLVVAVGAAVAILPVTIRNLTVGGEFVLLTTNGGINYTIGNHDGATGAFDKIQGIDFFQPDTGPDGGSRALASEQSGRELTPGQASRYWLGQGLRWNLGNPHRTVFLWGKKLVLALSDTEIPQIEDYGAALSESKLLRLNPVRFGWLAAFALVGLIVAWRRSPSSRLLALLIVSYLAPLLLFFVTGRFRVVLVPLLTVFAAEAILFIWRGLRAKRIRTAGSALGAAVVLSVLLNLYTPPGIEASSGMLRFYNRGITAMQEGDFPRAAQQFRHAAELDPDHVPTLANLAFCLTQLGDPERAVPLYRMAMELDPHATHLRRFLAEALLGSGQIEEAKTELERMLKTDPQDTWARHTLESLRDP